MANKFFKFSFAVSLFALVALGFVATNVMAEERQIVLGTGPVAGVNYPVGGALCRTLNEARSRTGLRCLIESTAGPAENLERLAQGDLDLALLQSDWQYYAPARLASSNESGEGSDETTLSDAIKLRAIVALHAQPFTLVVNSESGIASLADLEGKAVNLGPTDSAVRASGVAFLEALGWEADDWDAAPNLPTAALIDALCSSEIDAFLLPISHPNGLVGAVTERCQAKLIPIDGQAAEVLIETWPFYTSVKIPGGLYNANSEAVMSFGLRTTLVASNALSSDAVYDLTRLLFEQSDSVLPQHAALATVSFDESALVGNSLPFHEGAARYYQERGWLETESQ